MCRPCSNATVAALPLQVCHRQKDWAASIDSHMQQDTDVSKAPPKSKRSELFGFIICVRMVSTCFPHRSRHRTSETSIWSYSKVGSSVCHGVIVDLQPDMRLLVLPVPKSALVSSSSVSSPLLSSFCSSSPKIFLHTVDCLTNFSWCGSICLI